MSNPTAGDLRVHALLTQMGISWFQDPGKYIADSIFPVVNVQNRSDRYNEWSRADLLRSDIQKRGNREKAAEVEARLDNAKTYYAEEWAGKKGISDTDRIDSDPATDLEQVFTRLLTQQMKIRKDLEWTSKFFGPGIWDTDFTPVTAWDAAGGDPLTDITLLITDVEEATGFAPNRLVFGARTWAEGIQNNPVVIDRIKYTSADPMTPEIFARLAFLDKDVTVKVARAVFNSSVTKEDGSGVFQYIADPVSALLSYAPSAPSKEEPSAGYTFNWSKKFPGGLRMKKYRQEDEEADMIEIQAGWDQKQTSSALAIFIENAVTAGP